MTLAKRLSVLVLGFLITLPAAGQILARGKLADADDARAYADALRHLQARRLTVSWQDAPLQDAVRELRLHLSRIILFAPAAADRKTSPVTLELHDVSAASLLKVLEDSAKVRFLFEDGLIFVTTPEDATKRSLEIRIYDISDLLYEAPDFPGPPMEIHPGRITPPAPESEVRKKDGNEIVDLIRDLVGSDAWEVEGTSITVSHHMLIVRQSPAVHARVHWLVQTLCAFL